MIVSTSKLLAHNLLVKVLGGKLIAHAPQLLTTKIADCGCNSIVFLYF